MRDYQEVLRIVAEATAASVRASEELLDEVHAHTSALEQKVMELRAHAALALSRAEYVSSLIERTQRLQRVPEFGGSVQVDGDLVHSNGNGAKHAEDVSLEVAHDRKVDA